MKPQQLIFIYNANSDLFSTITDFANKILSPSTYDCHLCELPMEIFQRRRNGKLLLKIFLLMPSFFNKDDFIKRYKIENALPVEFIQLNENIEEFL
ncbi:MAG: GTPase [Bacteroidota bacterium]|nr:GTPase [Bacteroidota bacterium]